MKRLLLFIAAALVALPLAAQTKTWQIAETGWGRIERAARIGVAGSTALGEMNIPRWRKTAGTIKVDYDKREAVISLDRKKDKTFVLMTESRPFRTRDGWTYVEYEALDNRNAVCRFWVCTHENGSQRVLILYPYYSPDTVYGYRLAPAE